MKVAVTSTEPNIEAKVDRAFGRCAYYVVIDPSTGEWEAFANQASNAGGGAGIQAAQFVASKGVEVVVTGNVGPNAFQTLATAGVKVFVGASGSVQEAIKAYEAGSLQEATASNVPGHFGMGGRRGVGGGRQAWS